MKLLIGIIIFLILMGELAVYSLREYRRNNG